MGRGGRPSARTEAAPALFAGATFAVSGGGRRTLVRLFPRARCSPPPQTVLPGIPSFVCTRSRAASVRTSPLWGTGPRSRQSCPSESPGHTEQASEKGQRGMMGTQEWPSISGRALQGPEGREKGRSGPGARPGPCSRLVLRAHREGSVGDRGGRGRCGAAEGPPSPVELILKVLGRPERISCLPGSRLVLAVATRERPEQFPCQRPLGQMPSLPPSRTGPQHGAKPFRKRWLSRPDLGSCTQVCFFCEWLSGSLTPRGRQSWADATSLTPHQKWTVGCSGAGR